MVAWPSCALPGMSPLHLLDAYAPEIFPHAPQGPRALCAPALLQCQHPHGLCQVTLLLSKHGTSCGVLGSDIPQMWILISGVHINILEDRHKCKQNCVCHVVAYEKELWEACLEAPFAMLIQGFYTRSILFSLEGVIKNMGGRIKLPPKTLCTQDSGSGLKCREGAFSVAFTLVLRGLSEEAPAAAWSSGGPMG